MIRPTIVAFTLSRMVLSMQLQIDSLAVAALASTNFLRGSAPWQRKQRPERNPKKALHQKEVHEKDQTQRR
jgi:hypothetical protein